MEESMQSLAQTLAERKGKENYLSIGFSSPSSSPFKGFAALEDGNNDLHVSMAKGDALQMSLALQEKGEIRRGFQSPSSSSKKSTPRKPLKPLKSATQSDPAFQGVFIKVRPSVGKATDAECPSPRLIIDSFFTYNRGRGEPEEKVQARRPRKLKSSVELFPADDRGSLNHDSHSCTSSSSSTPSSSSSSPVDFDNDIGLTPIHVDKICASCSTSRTPLWRDAEDGTHLCNACGIRWKKYRIRCLRCWYIPRKEEKSLPSCPSCTSHGTIRFTISKRHVF